MVTPISNHSFPSPTKLLNTSLSGIKVKSIWNKFKERIGSQIRDSFFLPISDNLSADLEKRVKKETLFFQDFWDPTKPLNPHLSYHKQIRDEFDWTKQELPISSEGKELKIEYSLISPKKTSSQPPRNLLFLAGNTSTLENEIMHLYPYIVSYIKQSKENDSLPPLNILTISQYNIFEGETKYKPKNLNEAGLTLSKAIEAISKEQGKIDQIVSFSLGTIVFSAALKHLSNKEEILPSSLCFDRGPSSIKEASDRLGFTGWIAHKMAEFSGWDIDVGHEIKNYLLSKSNQNILITQVVNDFYFPGKASLAQSDHLQGLDPQRGIQILSFDFADQLHHLRGHHSLHAGLLDGYHVISENSSLLSRDESLSDHIVKSAMRSSPLYKDKHLGWYSKVQSLLSSVFGKLFFR